MSVSTLKESWSVVSTTHHSPPTIPPLILGSYHDRARAALTHVQRGLEYCSSQCSTLHWSQPGRARLLLKASQSYWVLADAGMSMNRLGRSLRYARLCILCCSECWVRGTREWYPGIVDGSSTSVLVQRCSKCFIWSAWWCFQALYLLISWQPYTLRQNCFVLFC